MREKIHACYLFFKLRFIFSAEKLRKMSTDTHLSFYKCRNTNSHFLQLRNIKTVGVGTYKETPACRGRRKTKKKCIQRREEKRRVKNSRCTFEIQLKAECKAACFLCTLKPQSIYQVREKEKKEREDEEMERS